jgi:hypothetical protein
LVSAATIFKGTTIATVMLKTPLNLLRLPSLIRPHFLVYAVMVPLCAATGAAPLAAQPTPPAEERVTVTEADRARIREAAMLAETANAAGLEWEPYYLAFMQLERRKDWSDKEIKLIGMYFGAIQGRYRKELGERTYSKEDVQLLHDTLEQETARLNREAAALPYRKRSE